MPNKAHCNAQYEGVCSHCSDAIETGQPIKFNSGKVYHFPDCARAAYALKVANEELISVELNREQWQHIINAVDFDEEPGHEIIKQIIALSISPGFRNQQMGRARAQEIVECLDQGAERTRENEKAREISDESINQRYR